MAELRGLSGATTHAYDYIRKFKIPEKRQELLLDKHAQYVLKKQSDHKSHEYVATEYLRLSGAYWSVTAMALLGRLDETDKESILELVFSCQHESGAFGPAPGHDAHLLYTLSAVQVLALYDELHRVDPDAIAAYVAGLQQPGGAFMGDEWGEIDTRFTYCAFNCLSLLDRMDYIDVDAATKFISECRNFDGGFGCVPGGESHAGQARCGPETYQQSGMPS